MSLQTALLCANCKIILNNEDVIFGTSCGHVYHFQCARNCHNSSTNCTQCAAFKPCIYKMYLEFGTTTLSWENSEKAIELHNDLAKKDSLLCELERKYKISQESVQKLEIKLKKLNDALKSHSSITEDLKDRIDVQETLNKYLQRENELLARKQAHETNIWEEPASLKKGVEKNENVSDQGNVLPTNNFDKTCETKTEIHSRFKQFTEYFHLNYEKNKTKEINNDDVKKQLSVDGENNETALEKVPMKIAEDLNENGSTSGQNSESIIGNNPLTTIVIKNYPTKYLKKWTPKQSVIYLARKMQLKLESSEIKNVVVIKKDNFKVATLIVIFVKSSSAEEFRYFKERLRKFGNTESLQIE